MVKRFLVTTALEETWHDTEPVLFLGEWCMRYSRKDNWSSLNSEVLPYHWDDRIKLYADYQYLQKFYERLLQDLTLQLNQIHCVNHSLRYWRILIGPWLGFFVQILFDRWASIQQAINQYDLSGTVVLTGKKEDLIPNNMFDFSTMYTGDEWNHHIYSIILQQFTSVSCIKKVRKDKKVVRNVSKHRNWKRLIKQALASWYARIGSALSKDTDAFFLSTYLPFYYEIKLHRRFGQVPLLWRLVATRKVAVDDDQRQWKVNGKNLSDFEAFVRAIIPYQIPKVYLEGYKQLVEQVKYLPWPKMPKVIWCSNSQIADDVFKAWAADKIELGSPLVIGQHGGHFGVGKWIFIENHDKAISDCYLTWGWSEPGKSTIKAVGQFKKKKELKVDRKTQQRALLVTAVVPRYSYRMFSAMISRQWLDYFNDQCRFVDNLSTNIKSALTVRLYAQDYGWDQYQRWHDYNPMINLDEGQTNIKRLIKQSKIYISTYNATTFLESFAMNIPTVIYWNPNHWELRDSAIPYFDNLKRVGIFHETPESAAKHVSDVWDDVDKWWRCREVQSVRDEFCQNFAYLPDDLFERVEEALRDAITIPHNIV